jgi:hypothetical protein
MTKTMDELCVKHLERGEFRSHGNTRHPVEIEPMPHAYASSPLPWTNPCRERGRSQWKAGGLTIPNLDVAPPERDPDLCRGPRAVLGDGEIAQERRGVVGSLRRRGCSGPGHVRCWRSPGCSARRPQRCPRATAPHHRCPPTAVSSAAKGRERGRGTEFGSRGASATRVARAPYLRPAGTRNRTQHQRVRQGMAHASRHVAYGIPVLFRERSEKARPARR